MTLLTVIGLGAAGGLIAEVAATCRQLQNWRQARHSAMRRRKPNPDFTQFWDPLSDPVMVLVRAVLGAVAAWALHSEVTGVYAALTVGASAPALLANLGKAATPEDAVKPRVAGHAQGADSSLLSPASVAIDAQAEASE